ncbi:hypothetical protein HY418_00815 [Candidatus Kaiserbacteria bacterium]|nr:hypothetical protein [Candidatus Kaiserbacteria bacterium]
MEGGPTVGGSFAWAIWFLGELAFKWVPGTAVSIVTSGIPSLPSPQGPSVGLISSPVTVPEAVWYLQSASAPGVWDNLFYHWSVFVAVSLFISLLLAALIIYCIVRIFQIRYRERLAFEAAAQTVSAQDIPRTQLRWQRIIDQMQTDDEQGWRLAVLEADIMLNELLDTLGYKGETMGDKMKQVERSDFHTIDQAWEAHAFRNRIAHETAHLRLDKSEVEHAIGLYRRVLREFHFVE